MKKNEAIEIKNQADEYVSRELYDVAVKHYIRAYTMCEDIFNSEDFSLVGSCYLEIKDYKAAAIFFDKAIETLTNPNEQATVYSEAAEAYELLENHPKTIENLLKMISSHMLYQSIKEHEMQKGFDNEFFAKNYYKISQFYGMMGKKEEELYYLGRSKDFGYNLEEDDNNIKTSQPHTSSDEQYQKLLKKATKLFVEDNYIQAAKIFKEVFIITPEAFDGFELFAMGITCYHIQDYSMAKACLEGATVLDTDINRQFYAYFFVSHICIILDQEERARHFLEQPFSLAKDNLEKSTAYFQRGRVEDTVGKPSKAIDSFYKSIDHLLQHLSHTEADVMAGKVKNDRLAEIYFSIATTLYKFENKDWEKIDSYMQKAALCGVKRGLS